MSTKYELFYDLAYELAEFAYSHDEVPVGAVIIKDNIIMKDGYISINDKPGLGVDVDETYLNEIKI